MVKIKATGTKIPLQTALLDSFQASLYCYDLPGRAKLLTDKMNSNSYFEAIILALFANQQSWALNLLTKRPLNNNQFTKIQEIANQKKDLFLKDALVRANREGNKLYWTHVLNVSLFFAASILCAASMIGLLSFRSR